MEKKGKVLMERYEFGRLLGQGSFAKVYYARDIQTGKSVAVKVLDKDKVFKVGLIEQTKREISAMKIVKHPNVLQLYEVMASKTKIYYIMEYAKGGELFNKVSKGRLKEVNARKYFRQLINAIDFCHRRGVYHRDLKLENLLLDEKGILKISDFGFSAVSESKRIDGLLHTTCGTPAYVAPEVLRRRGYDGAISDIWSCGVILYVLLAGYLPFRDLNVVTIYKRISRGEYKCPSWISPEARRLLAKMLDPNPKTRISVSGIMRHSWFQKGLIDHESAQVVLTPADLDHKCCNTTTTTETASNDPSSSIEIISKRKKLNAFDIISLAAGFDLSGLFSYNNNITLLRDDVHFTSMKSGSEIVFKFMELAKGLNLKITVKEEEGVVRLERPKDYCMMNDEQSLSVDVKIYEFSSCFHLVEVSKSSGDSLEFHMLLNDDIRIALDDVIWAWQGDQQKHGPH